MGDWRTQGSAARRRTGAPTATVEGAWHRPTSGPPSSEGVDSAVAAMTRTGQGRVPMGTTAVTGLDNVSGTNTGRTTLTRHNTPNGGDPTVETYTPRGSNPTRVTSQERSGASYHINAVVTPPADPAVTGQTMANGRIVTNQQNKQLGSFSDERGLSSL